MKYPKRSQYKLPLRQTEGFLRCLAKLFEADLPSPAWEERNRNIHSIHELGRREWHERSGYSKRSMVENTVYRYKTIIGRSLRSRTFAGQRVEVQLAGKILNTMIGLGMPDSHRVA